MDGAAAKSMSAGNFSKSEKWTFWGGFKPIFHTTPQASLQAATRKTRKTELYEIPPKSPLTFKFGPTSGGTHVLSVLLSVSMQKPSHF